MSPIEHIKQAVSLSYYIMGGLAFLAALIRVLYGWFRDYDNAIRFTTDMANSHLPYVYQSLQRIANKLDVELEAPPAINFSQGKNATQQ